MEPLDRINAEWVTLNAVRGLTKLATNGDMRRSTYDVALDFGAELYPELLGPDVSLLRRAHESDDTKEYRQKAAISSRQNGVKVTALSLVEADIQTYEGLINYNKGNSGNKREVDKLTARLSKFEKCRQELDPQPHSENSLIFRDSSAEVREDLRAINTGKGFRDFELPNHRVLRVRVLHPDKPEQVTGADVIYERHRSTEQQEVSIVAVQYKIWQEKTLYLSDQRMREQIGKMRFFLCDKSFCEGKGNAKEYRFPYCSAFLRPTDKFQSPNQRLISKGEYIPICHIDGCTSTGSRGAEVLEYKNMRDVSLSADAFEFLFNTGKIGSDWMTQDALDELYSGSLTDSRHNQVVIYAQEFAS